jgi:cell division protein YceG involved in septum cleavage
MRYLSFVIIAMLVIISVFAYRVSVALIMKQDFIVSHGDTISSLREKLDMDIGFFPYKAYIRLKQNDFILQAGTYHMKGAQSLDEFFATTLTHPISKDITITILPGWNIFDIDVYLTKQGIIKSGDFIRASENISSELYKTFSFV